MPKVKLERRGTKELDYKMDPITYKQHSVKETEEEKLAIDPILRTRSTNTTDSGVSDRFIP